MADLLAALMPRVGAAPAASASLSAPFGVLPLFLAAGKGVQAGLKWVQSPKGQRFLQKLKDTEDRARQRQKLYQAKADRASDPAAKARWQRRADRERRRLDDARITKMLAEKGIVEKGPVLEYKRNLLAMQWEDASPERKKEIEAQIARMDRRLKALHQEQQLLERTMTAASPVASSSVVPSASSSKISGSRQRGPTDATPRRLEQEVTLQAREALVPWGKRPRKLASLPPVPRALLTADKMIVSGMGASRYAVQAPPGPGRLVRIPFYPENDIFSWSGPNGIDFKGDDPVIRLEIDVARNPRRARPLLLRTERFDYGSYQILGFQVNEQGNSKPVVNGGGPLTLGPIVVTFRNLQLYNGQTLFLQENQIWSATFNMFPASYSVDILGGSSGNSTRIKLPGVYERRRSRWFAGLRDYPLVTGTTFVSVQVGAFSTFAADAESPVWEIPITCNVIAEMVEDKVFGDPINPSPAARGGATVKVTAREMGTSWEGRPQVQIVSARKRRRATE